MNLSSALTLTFSPLLPPDIISGFIILGISLALLRPGTFITTLLRLFSIFLITLYLSGPALLREQRALQSKTVAIIMDRSASMELPNRREQADQARDKILAQLKNLPGIIPRVIDRAPINKDETDLYATLQSAFNGIPAANRGGAILITDGLIHDGPATEISPHEYGPVHTLLAGRPQDFDIRLTLESAPLYGLVHTHVTARIKLEYEGPGQIGPQEIQIEHDNQMISRVLLGPGQQIDIPLPITQSGENLYIASVSPRPGELTPRNNILPLTVRGLRDRVRVLLVSAEPYMGGRMWRNLLTSDPGIDLVHFTILRSPDSIDPTPSSDLALIPFPFEDLFATKLKDFDVVILDRYRANLIMPNRYLDNIAEFVKNGGGLLEISDSGYDGPNSITQTELGKILPGRPDGPVQNGMFKPTLTLTGQAHPVTAALSLTTPEKWGHWYTYIPVKNISGSVLLEGPGHTPLLSVSRIDQGRIAQFSSDQLWLWARGHDGGGPYHDLLRPVLHWLLKEQELDEEALTLHMKGDDIEIIRHTLDTPVPDTRWTGADGQTHKANLTPDGPGRYKAAINAPPPGIYRVISGTEHTTMAVGNIDTPEWQQLVATSDRAKRLFKKTGGRVFQQAEIPAPSVRLVHAGDRAGGENWIGVYKAEATKIIGQNTHDLFPPLFWMVLLGAGILTAWFADGGKIRRKI